MSNSKLKMYLSDYAGACDDVSELSEAIIAMTNKPTVAFALIDLLIQRAKFAGACLANARNIGFEGTPQEALIESLESRWLTDQNEE